MGGSWTATDISADCVLGTGVDCTCGISCSCSCDLLVEASANRFGVAMVRVFFISKASTGQCSIDATISGRRPSNEAQRVVERSRIANVNSYDTHAKWFRINFSEVAPLCSYTSRVSGRQSSSSSVLSGTVARSSVSSPSNADVISRRSPGRLIQPLRARWSTDEVEPLQAITRLSLFVLILACILAKSRTRGSHFFRSFFALLLLPAYCHRG